MRLGAPVAFAERVDVVDLLVVVGQSRDEGGSGKACQELVRRKFCEADCGRMVDESVGEEEVGTGDVLANVHRVHISSPVVNVLKEVMVNRLEFAEVVGRGNGRIEELEGTGKRQVGLSRGERLRRRGTDKVPENVALRNQIGVGEFRRVHTGLALD